MRITMRCAKETTGVFAAIQPYQSLVQGACVIQPHARRCGTNLRILATAHLDAGMRARCSSHLWHHHLWHMQPSFPETSHLPRFSKRCGLGTSWLLLASDARRWPLSRNFGCDRTWLGGLDCCGIAQAEACFEGQLWRLDQPAMRHPCMVVFVKVEVRVAVLRHYECLRW
jgi:hypothetical protein